MPVIASVVIPTWNRAALLPDCLTSLMEQDLPAESWEIVVVDDGSTDDTPATVQRLADEAAQSGITVVYERLAHVGLNAARNAGAAKARGELICFIDDDVRTPATWLSSLVSGVHQNPGAAAYGGPIRLLLEGPLPRTCGREVLGETDQDNGPDVCEPPTLWGSNLTIPKESLATFGGFDVSLQVGGDETEWLMRAKARGGRLLYLPEPAVHHLRRAAELTLTSLLVRRFGRGRAQINFGRVTGSEYKARQELAQLCRSLGHSARYRCGLGLLPVATSAGRLMGMIIGPRRDPGR